MNEDMFVFSMWNEDKKLTVKYSKSEDINESIFRSIIKIRTGILISGDIPYFATAVRIVNMSVCWCDWCTLSTKECLDESHTKGMLWTIDLMKKSLNDQIVNEKITSYEKNMLKHYYLILFQLRTTFLHYYMQQLV